MLPFQEAHPHFDAASAGKRRLMPSVPWLGLCCLLSSFPKSAQENLWKRPRKCCSALSTVCILTARLGSLFCKDRSLLMKRDFSFKHTYSLMVFLLSCLCVCCFVFCFFFPFIPSSEKTKKDQNFLRDTHSILCLPRCLLAQLCQQAFCLL